jgi:intein/homing endonuclease
MTINGPESVIAVSSPLRNTLIKYTFDDGSSTICTMDHPLFVVDKGWASCHPNYSRYRYNIETAQLKINDKILSLQNKQKTLISFNLVHADDLSFTRVYTLKTESQTFYANDLLAHSEI